MNEYGADTLRLYEMFMGPLTESKPWSTEGIVGANRWIKRVWRMYLNDDNSTSDMLIADNDGKLDKVYNQTVKKVTDDIEKMRFNTAISQMMVFVNEVYKNKTLPKRYAEGFIKLLSPITPHMAEEIWQQLGHKDTIAYAEWPTYDESKLKDDQAELVVQINGKVRAHITVAVGTSKDDIEKIALADDNIKNNLQNKTVRKVIVIPNKIVNIVAN